MAGRKKGEGGRGGGREGRDEKIGQVGRVRHRWVVRDTDCLIEVLEVPVDALETVLELRASCLDATHINLTVQQHAPLRVLALCRAQRMLHLTVEEEGRGKGGGKGGRCK